MVSVNEPRFNCPNCSASVAESAREQHSWEGCVTSASRTEERLRIGTPDTALGVDKDDYKPHKARPQSAEPRTQGMSAKPRHWDVELFWREWANQQYFTIAITDNIKHVAKCFAISFCEQETIRLREALRHAQSTVGFFASVIKSGERWSATCQEALDKVSSAAAPTKKTDSPK